MSTVVLSGIRVVVFDLDDTLYPERSFVFSGFEAVAARLRQRMACPIDPAARMRELFGAEDRRHVFDRLLSEMACDESETWVPAMIQHYRSHAPAIRLYDDAQAVLDRWRGRFRLGLISDGPAEMQQNKIEALGLVERLDRVVLTDRWGQASWKPHPRAYREMQAAFDADGPECVYIADNAEKDFVAPRPLGWRTVRVRRPDGIYAETVPPAGGEPEHEVASLTEIDIN